MFEDILDRPVSGSERTPSRWLGLTSFGLVGGVCGMVTSALTTWVAGKDYYNLLMGFDESGLWSQPVLRGSLKGICVGLVLGGWYLLLSLLKKPPRTPLHQATLTKTLQSATLTLILCWLAGILFMTVWIQTTPERIMDAYFPGGLTDRQWVRAVSCTLGSLVGRLLGIFGSALVVTLSALRRPAYNGLGESG